MLSDVTIVIPTFHRRGYLKDCLRTIEENLPECKVVVISDDGVIPQTENEIFLPFDSGLTAKRNAGVKRVKTDYTLIGCDDFDFSTADVRKGIIQMAEALRDFRVDVVAGRVNSRPYEGYLKYVSGEYIKERRLDINLKLNIYPIVDIAANYFVARTEVLREVPWDENIRPIGGEHVDWFLDMKAAGKIVIAAPWANIDQMPYDASKQHPLYKQYRNRAFSTGHQLMMEKRGIKNYFGFDDEVK